MKGGLDIKLGKLAQSHRQKHNQGPHNPPGIIQQHQRQRACKSKRACGGVESARVSSAWARRRVWRVRGVGARRQCSGSTASASHSPRQVVHKILTVT